MAMAISSAGDAFFARGATSGEREGEFHPPPRIVER
jgi:hypothetical protein